MRSRRMAVFFVIIVLAGVVAVFNNAVFCISKIDVIGAEESLGRRVAQASLAADKNILTLNKSQIIDNIARTVPECRVLQVERVFPNKIIIRSVKRNPSAYVRLDGDYYILSEDMAVLEITGTVPSLTAIEVNGSQMWSAGGAKIGYVLPLSQDGSVAAVTEVMAMLNGVEGFDPSCVRSINVRSSAGEVSLSTTTGVRITVSGFDRAGDKLRLALSLYAAYPAYRYSGKILAFADGLDNLKVSYIKN